MYANPLFSKIVSEYKERYKLGYRDTFSSYCKCFNVKPASVTQWMRRHGMSVSCLRVEALLEQQIDGPIKGRPVLDLDLLEKVLNGDVRGLPKVTEVDPCCLLKGITISFPDGVSVSVRSATAETLEKFISSYNPSYPSICLP